MRSGCWLHDERSNGVGCLEVVDDAPALGRVHVAVNLLDAVALLGQMAHNGVDAGSEQRKDDDLA